MKLKTVVLNTSVKKFQSEFLKSKHVIFQNLEFACDIEGNKILCEVAEKDKLVEPTALAIEFSPVSGENYAFVVFDVIHPWGYMGLVNPSFSVAAWLHNTYQCIQFVDVDTGKDVNILHRTGGMKMSVHNTSDTPMRHELGVFSI